MLEAMNPCGINGACSLPPYFEGAVEQTGYIFKGDPNLPNPLLAILRVQKIKQETSCVTRDASLHEG